LHTRLCTHVFVRSRVCTLTRVCMLTRLCTYASASALVLVRVQPRSERTCRRTLTRLYSHV
jgi:hypothetical protein